MTPNAPQCAVIQVKPGIGDVIWHLPFIRAIAAVSPGGRVSFLAPPTSGAKDLLAAEPAVAETIYFEHAGSEWRRGINLIRLVALLRRHRFRSIWILDRTTRPALAAMLAGIPERVGLGLGSQNHFITNPGIDRSHFHDHPVDWLRALMAAMKVPLPSTEPSLQFAPATLAAIGEKFAGRPRPWIVLGLGASHPQKDWSDASWLEFLAGLCSATAGTVFLIGGAMNTARAQTLIAPDATGRAVNACDLKLTGSAALLRHADLFVGTIRPDESRRRRGDRSLRAVRFDAGAELLEIHPRYRAPDGPSADGMRRILPAQVLAEIAPYLSRQKARG